MADAASAASRHSLPLARSPIATVSPERVCDGWVVSGCVSTAALTITDLTPLTKVLVRAPVDGEVAAMLGVGHGRAVPARLPTAGSDGDDAGGLDVLVVGSGPGEWTVLTQPGRAGDVIARLDGVCAASPGTVTLVDLTHGRALVRLAGDRAVDVLAKECAVDLSPLRCPDGTALRTVVSGVVADVVRRDREPGHDPLAGPEFVVHVERSSGQYLFDCLCDAGAEFGIEVQGFDGLWGSAGMTAAPPPTVG